MEIDVKIIPEPHQPHLLLATQGMATSEEKGPAPELQWPRDACKAAVTGSSSCVNSAVGWHVQPCLRQCPLIKCRGTASDR